MVSESGIKGREEYLIAGPPGATMSQDQADQKEGPDAN